MRRGCRHWLASPGHRARARARPHSDPAANPLQGTCQCPHPRRPEPAHGLSPSLLQGEGVPAKLPEFAIKRVPTITN